MYILTTNFHRQLVHEDLSIYFSKNGGLDHLHISFFVCIVINFSLLHLIVCVLKSLWFNLAT